ncbi:DUF2284 domain-containing protein [Thermodesulfobacteriota bacterium]
MGATEKTGESSRRDGSIGQDLKELIRLARGLGMSGGAAVSTRDIVIDDGLAELCRKPGCDNYGLSPSCPPHVGGPSRFRELRERFEHALVVKIDVPTEILLSVEVRDIMRLLHEIVSRVEGAAVEMGYSDSQAFAGGSCKKLFCPDHADCRILEGDGNCRNPENARPSMSGFGIDVARLMQAATWTLGETTGSEDGDGTSTAPLCGLVLVG